jgi:thiamine biosynthesis lipoprotein ApbE
VFGTFTTANGWGVVTSGGRNTQINKNGKIYGKFIDFYKVLREVMPL